MPRSAPVKHPCVQCKEKHLKCDDRQPKCQRCETAGFPCRRAQKKDVFRQGGVGHFAKNQKWVATKAKGFKMDSHADGSLYTSQDEEEGLDEEEESPPPPKRRRISTRNLPPASPGHSEGRQESGPSVTASATHVEASKHSHPSPGSILHVPKLDSFARRTSASYFPIVFDNAPNMDSHAAGGHFSNQYDLPSVEPYVPPIHGGKSEETVFPLADVQEACLLRYYVEELSHWFDLCDEERHFQLVVPIRARKHPHLLNAIFAVAARHLSRLPQFKAPSRGKEGGGGAGVMYYGQHLPHLNQHTAVEYVLRCIPALRHFHDSGSDDEYRDSVIATAVILRQLEEIDDEEADSLSGDGGSDGGGSGGQINFLAIINSVLRTLPSQTLFWRSSLTRAAFWMSLRQEIYHSFTRGQAPQLELDAAHWQSASQANKTVMHTVQVAQWRWGDGSEAEWHRLMRQQQHLENDILSPCQPILHRPANKAQGEIFPTIWYATATEITSRQAATLSRAVLTAEDPSLHQGSSTKSRSGGSRAAVREAEGKVRGLILELCGIALCHPKSPPAMIHSAFGVMMYGDFFVDVYEREALRGLVDKYREAHAWPVQRLIEMFR